MRHCRQLAFAGALFVLAGGAFAQAEPLKPLQMTPDEVMWSPRPTGLQLATVVGNPSKQGIYVNRVKFPPGFKVLPHFHPDERVVTVLSGTLYVGYGEQFDQNKMRPVPVGGIWTEPMKQPHFVWAKDGEVIIQVVGVGPSGTTQVTESAK